jgi:hypothetical protein
MFEAKDMYARIVEMRACDDGDFSWVDLIAAEGTKVLRAVEACLLVQAELSADQRAPVPKSLSCPRLHMQQVSERKIWGAL